MNMESRRGALLRLASGMALLGHGGAGALAGMSGLDALDPLLQPAPRNAKATEAVMVSVASAGRRAVAVGESGLVIFSDDGGSRWTQAQVPVSVTLTAVCFASERLGWAAGHSGVILSTTDGGANWGMQMGLAPKHGESAGGLSGAGRESDPLLDIYFRDPMHGFAIGAFGRFLRTSDGGKTWSVEEKLLPNPEGNHLYAIREIGGAIYVVGERGSIYMSTDAARTFTLLKSPYEGSFFGIAAAPRDSLVVFGLRGRAFVSSSRGADWAAVPFESASAWTGAAALPCGRTALVGQGGEVAIGSVEAGAVRFSTVPGRNPPLSAVCATAQGDLIAVGPRGVHALSSAKPAKDCTSS